MKLKSILLVCALLLIGKSGIAQTEHATINKAWATLNKAYRLRNETMVNLADTLRNRQAISNKAYRDLSKQVQKLNQSLSSDPLTGKRMRSIADKNDKLTKAFGKLILMSGAKSPDHYYIENLEALENRLHLYKRVFNDACTAKGRKELRLPFEPAS
ncbi:MAG: hypothetical protein EOP54_01440 [Sphingobacteriales bacterium]|nr:MAG: hypothetical protein EOP54_01440 [Sphingobacteriales bacterium]